MLAGEMVHFLSRNKSVHLPETKDTLRAVFTDITATGNYLLQLQIEMYEALNKNFTASHTVHTVQHTEVCLLL